MSKKAPRLVIASTQSGGGKTTVTLAIMAALAGRGFKVQGYKCGPDYIDPGHHAMATGRVSVNVDSWFTQPALLKDIFLKSAQDADISIIEGVMGLFDGKSAVSNEGSTAEIAQILDAPVILTLDCSKQARSAAAIVRGFMEFCPGVKIAGVIANKVGSDSHARMIQEAIEKENKIPVLGFLKKDPGVEIKERHLGLLPANEHTADTQNETGVGNKPKEYINALAQLAETSIDLEKCLQIANNAGALKSNGEFSGLIQFKPRALSIGVAKDDAFSFYYSDNLKLMEAAGMKIHYFSPLKNETPGPVSGLYFGGGFPEIFAKELAKQTKTAAAIKELIENGIPALAECGGLMYLVEELMNTDGVSYKMAGALPGKVIMQTGRAALGYREATGLNGNFLIDHPARGHEFHYSRYEHDGVLPSAYLLKGRNGEKEDGVLYKNLCAGYMHFYFASEPRILENWANKCFQYKS